MFRNYTHSKPRFRALLAGSDARVLEAKIEHSCPDSNQKVRPSGVRATSFGITSTDTIVEPVFRLYYSVGTTVTLRSYRRRWLAWKGPWREELQNGGETLGCKGRWTSASIWPPSRAQGQWKGPWRRSRDVSWRAGGAWSSSTTTRPASRACTVCRFLPPGRSRICAGRSNKRARPSIS